MIEFFKEGGYGMWPILFIGLVLIAAAGRYAYKPENRRLGFLGAMALAVLLSTASATLTDFATVCHAVSHDERIAEQDRTRVFLQGMKETTRPGVFGAMVLTIGALLLAVGEARRARAEEA